MGNSGDMVHVHLGTVEIWFLFLGNRTYGFCSWGTFEIRVLFMENSGDMGPVHGNSGDIGPCSWGTAYREDIGPAHGKPGRCGTWSR
jgi:hypothetical protein